MMFWKDCIKISTYHKILSALNINVQLKIIFFNYTFLFQIFETLFTKFLNITYFKTVRVT